MPFSRQEGIKGIKSANLCRKDTTIFMLPYILFSEGRATERVARMKFHTPSEIVTARHLMRFQKVKLERDLFNTHHHLLTTALSLFQFALNSLEY